MQLTWPYNSIVLVFPLQYAITSIGLWISHLPQKSPRRRRPPPLSPFRPISARSDGRTEETSTPLQPITKRQKWPTKFSGFQREREKFSVACWSSQESFVSHLSSVDFWRGKNLLTLFYVEESKTMYGFPGYPLPPGSGPAGGSPGAPGSPYPTVHFYGANGPDKQATALSFLGKKFVHIYLTMFMCSSSTIYHLSTVSNDLEELSAF